MSIWRKIIGFLARQVAEHPELIQTVEDKAVEAATAAIKKGTKKLSGKS